MLQKRPASFDQMIYSRTHARVLFILGKQNQSFLLTAQPKVQGSSKVWKITLRPRKYNKYFAVLHTIYMYRQTNRSVVVSLTTLLWLSFAINFTPYTSISYHYTQQNIPLYNENLKTMRNSYKEGERRSNLNLFQTFHPLCKKAYCVSKYELSYTSSIQFETLQINLNNFASFD